MYVAAIATGVNWGIQGVALSVLAVYAINVPCYYFVNIRPLLRAAKNQSTHLSSAEESEKGITHA